jgi:hypothetical protein
MADISTNYVKAVVFHHDREGKEENFVLYEFFNEKRYGAAQRARTTLEKQVHVFVVANERPCDPHGRGGYRPQAKLSIFQPVEAYTMDVIGDTPR